MCKNEKILKSYIFIVLYSCVLKLLLGRWGTLVADIATIVVLFMCVGIRGRLKSDKNIKALFILVILIQLIAVIEILHPNIQNTLYSIIEYRKSYFQLLALMVTYWTFKKTKRDTIGMLKYIGNISLPIILYGIKQYFFWGSIDSKLVDMTDANFYTMHYGGHMRSVSIFSGPFHYGMFCAVLFAVYVFLFSDSRIKKSKRIYLIYAILATAGAVCSITRTSLICIIVCLAIWFLLYLRRKKNTSAIVIKSLTAMTVVFVLFVVFTGLFEFSFLNSNSSLGRMLNSLGNLSGDNRFTSRTSTWQEGIRCVISSPIVGYGMGSAADTMSSYNISNVYLTSHSMFIKLFMEIGVIGGLMYLSVFFICIKKIININKRSDEIKVLCLSLISIVMLNGLVGSTIPSFPSMTLYWIIMGILLNSGNGTLLSIKRSIGRVKPNR